MHSTGYDFIDRYGKRDGRQIWLCNATRYKQKRDGLAATQGGTNTQQHSVSPAVFHDDSSGHVADSNTAASVSSDSIDGDDAMYLPHSEVPTRLLERSSNPQVIII